jgi:hypothetical protein
MYLGGSEKVTDDLDDIERQMTRRGNSRSRSGRKTGQGWDIMKRTHTFKAKLRRAVASYNTRARKSREK